MADDIIEELHRIREEYAASFNYDLHAICADLKAKQKKLNQKVVSRKPRLLADEGKEKQ